MTVRLGDLVGSAGLPDAELVGNPDAQISGISTLEAAGTNDLTFLSHPKYLAKLDQCKAACVIVSPTMREAAKRRGNCIVVPDPYYYFAMVTQWWKRNLQTAAKPSIHPSAVIDASADWAVVSFHTVPAEELIEERPADSRETGTRQTKYLEPK